MRDILLLLALVLAIAFAAPGCDKGEHLNNAGPATHAEAPVIRPANQEPGNRQMAARAEGQIVQATADHRLLELEHAVDTLRLRVTRETSGGACSSFATEVNRDLDNVLSKVQDLQNLGAAWNSGVATSTRSAS